MEIDEILKHLERFSVPFPRAAVEAAVAQQAAITPRLLGILEKVAADPSPYLADEDRCDYIFALYLLAKFRETRAFAPIARMVSDETAQDLLGDVVTEGLGRILASVSGDDDAAIKALIEDEELDEYVRAAAMEALVAKVGAGLRARAEVMQYFAGLFRTLGPEESWVWTALCHCCLDLCPVEVEDDIRRVHDAGLTEPTEAAPEDVDEAIEEGIDAALQRLGERGYRLIDDVEKEMSWMAGFHPKETVPALAPHDELDEDPFEPPETYQREGPKIGRNDPCPCGSGKKFKKCCGK